MTGQYVGVLCDVDPLYRLLAEDVAGRVLGFEGLRPVFDVYALDASNTVFRYADRRSYVNLVGKFYGNKWIDGQQTGQAERRASLMQREYDNLSKLRALGFSAYPHSVVRPLAVDRTLNCVLVEERAWGARFDTVIHEAIRSGDGSKLYGRLADLAWFLADLHNRSQGDEPADGVRGTDYLDKVIAHLSHWNIISAGQREQLTCLRERWRASNCLHASRQVLNHGDPIFPNFFCSEEHGITSVDLERLWPGDPAMDLGCVVAELKHLFFLHAHDPWASEPFIRHFYESYYGFLPLGTEEWSQLTTRGRFYMGCYELRIGRNAWLDLDYRRALVAEAAACLAI